MKSPQFNIDIFNIPKDTLEQRSAISHSDYIIILYKEDYNSHRELLHKIFSAVKLELESYPGLVLLNKGEEINVARHTSDSTQFVFAFGIAPAKLGLNGRFSGYHIYTTETFSFLLCHSLAQLSVETAKKKALWEVLQQVFASDLA